MKYCLTLILALGFVSIGICQPKPFADKSTIRAFCDSFMAKVVQGKVSAAIDGIKLHSKIDPVELDRLGEVIASQLSSLETYGKILSFEFIKEKAVKESLAKLYYMLKFENSCLKFNFRLYNSGAGWFVTDIDFSQKVEEFFE